VNKADFLRLVGESEDHDYAPIAGMLQTGYGFAGFVNARLNSGMDETLILLNARLVDITGTGEDRSTPRVSDFNEFVEEIVLQSYRTPEDARMPREDIYGKSIPIAAIPYGQIVVIYPVGQIRKLMRNLEAEKKTVTSFLDFQNKSVIIKLLRSRLW